MTDQTPVHRREYMAALGASVVVGAPFTLRGDGALTDLAQAYANAEADWSFGSVDADTLRYGGAPSWSFRVEDSGALEDWVGESDDRMLLRHHEPTNTATVAAPVVDVAGGLASGGVATEGWVEWIDLNARVSLIDPIHSISEDDFAEFGQIEALLLGTEEPPTTGVAFDAEQRTLGDARETIADDDTAEGSDATVSVIDTGLTYDADLFGREVDGVTEARVLDASANFVATDDPMVGEEGLDVIEDGNGHGNWVTAAAAAGPADTDYRGVAPDADILALRALDDDGEGSTADIAAAVRHAAEHGADAICLSLGSPFYSADLADAIEYASDEGAVVVAAAGNDRHATRFVNFPASHPDAVAVGATTATADPDTVESAAFSNVGPAPGTLDHSSGETADVEVDIAAPGMELEAETADGFDTLSGTSMAAPFVAGAGALLADAGAADTRDRLTRTAQPAEQLAAAETQHGLLDVTAALQDTEPTDEQVDVMDDAAETRDSAYRSEAELRGRRLAGVLF